MLLLPFPFAAEAATTHVVSEDGAGGYADIGAAVAAAQDGDVILIHPGTYTEGVELSRDLELVGLEVGSARPLLVSTSAAGFFHVSGAAVTLRDLDFEGAGTEDADPDTRAIVQVSGALQVQGCTFAGHRTDRSNPVAAGGAIRVEGGSLTVQHVRFSGNRSNFGGHLWLAPGSVGVVEHSTLEAGYAGLSGGAISFEPGSTLSVHGSTFIGNEAHKNGGAIGIGLVSGGALSVSGSTFRDNRAHATVPGNGDGGAIHLLRAEVGPTTVRTSRFCGNEAERRGGAIAANGGTVILEGNAFVGNAVDGGTEFGGAISNEGGSIVLERSTLVGNRGANGQALSCTAGNITVSSSVFAHHAVGNAPLLFVGGTGTINGGADTTVWHDGTLGNASLTGVDDADPLIAAPPADPCDASLLPAPGSPLWTEPGRASAGAVTDLDGDGRYTLIDDCDDGDSTVHVGAEEVPADGKDQDCDGLELCFADTDGDGLGEEALIPSYDLDCTGFGEASAHDDDCVGTDDDGDGYCGDDDVCPGHDDRLDADGDGIPDGCDACPHDPTNRCTPGRDGGSVTIQADGHPPGCGCAVQGGRNPAMVLAIAALAYWRANRRANPRSGRAHASR